MKRRNFLKTVIWVLSIPATLCSAKTNQHRKPITRKIKKTTSNLINHNNIKINGTFEEWIQSIVKEVRRLLTVKSKEPDAYWFRDNYDVCIDSWKWKKDIPARGILIYKGKEKRIMGYFSFAEVEFNKNRKNPKWLRNLLNVRFIDCIWSMYDMGREHTIFLKKFGIDCSIPYTEY